MRNAVIAALLVGLAVAGLTVLPISPRAADVSSGVQPFVVEPGPAAESSDRPVDILVEPRGRSPQGSHHALGPLLERAEELTATAFRPDYPEEPSSQETLDAWLNAVDDRLDLTEALEGDLLKLTRMGDSATAAEAMVTLAELYLGTARALETTAIPDALPLRAAERFAVVIDDRVAVQEDKALLLYDVLESQIVGWPTDHAIRERILDGRARVPGATGPG